MKLNLKVTVLFLLSCVFVVKGFSSAVIDSLRTEYLPTPIGIDDFHPRFSWQMISDKIGAGQQAYRILVAKSEKELESGKYVFDSEKVYSGISVGIPYQGDVLRPVTKYYWKVEVWDEKNNRIESRPSWFETGLMGQGWNNAKWIGSNEVMLSKYRTFFIIDFDVRIPEGNNRAVFVYSAKDKGNFISIELDVSDNPKFIIRHTVEGVEHEDYSEDVSHIIEGENKHKMHHLRLKVTTPGYHLKSFLNPEIDGTPIWNKTSDENFRPNVSSSNRAFVIDPYPDGERVHDYARLHSIGFKQPEGQRAIFSNISISEDNWDAELYKDTTHKHDVSGKGELFVWEPYGHISAPMLRKKIDMEKQIKSARLYVTARGIYDFYVNGNRVSNDYFNPGWTDYRYRIMYNSYDITSMVKKGVNGFGAILGAGWFSDLNIFTASMVDPYGIRQSLLAKILVWYEDGTMETIVTDTSWKRFDHGPITRDGFQFGEDYDARKEISGWTEGSFDDSSWPNAAVLEKPAANVVIQSYVGLPIRNNITLTAKSVTEPVKGTYVYDLGVNMVGVPRIEGMQGLSGQVVKLRYGEMIYPEIIPNNPIPPYTTEVYKKLKGQVYNENYRGAISFDNYIMKGKSPSGKGESYQPHFTQHGFRYISITGLDKPLPLDHVKGIVLESIGHSTSNYVTSDSLVNQLFQNIQWGQRGNFLSIPTDCPQRDERVGWTGDAQVFARTATYFSPYIGRFYDRWLYSMRDNQNGDGSYANYYPMVGQPPYGYSNDGRPGSMGWMEAGIIVPWQVYLQFGDSRILERHYSSMAAYMNFLELRADNFIQPAGSLGDHLAIEPTNNSLTNTAYFAYDTKIMEQIAHSLGKKDDELHFSGLYANIKRRFNETFVNEEGITVAPYTPMFRFGRNPQRRDTIEPGTIVPVNTQTSYVVPLQAGLFNEKNKPLAVQYLVKNIREHHNTLTTGFIGTPYLNLVLSENGESDVAYSLFEQQNYPSWLYPVVQGATTMWERWNSYTIENGFGPVDMNSFNHYAYGAIGEWIFSYSLGIQPDVADPGYKHFYLRPKTGGKMSYASGYFESPYGKIFSKWEKGEKEGYATYTFEIPANTTATLELSDSDVSRLVVIEGKEGIVQMRDSESGVIADLRAGKFVIKSSSD